MRELGYFFQLLGEGKSRCVDRIDLLRHFEDNFSALRIILFLVDLKWWGNSSKMATKRVCKNRKTTMIFSN